MLNGAGCGAEIDNRRCRRSSLRPALPFTVPGKQFLIIRSGEIDITVIDGSFVRDPQMPVSQIAVPATEKARIRDALVRTTGDLTDIKAGARWKN